jgi:hypothetical protein
LDLQRVGQLFDIDDSVVSALPDAASTDNSRDKFFAWTRYASTRGPQFGVELMAFALRRDVVAHARQRLDAALELCDRLFESVFVHRSEIVEAAAACQARG